MCMVRHLGKPSYFITMTCNPNWPELNVPLAGRPEKVRDRPDLCARVFELKVNELIRDIYDRQIFGKVAAYFGGDTMLFSFTNTCQ